MTTFSNHQQIFGLQSTNQMQLELSDYPNLTPASLPALDRLQGFINIPRFRKNLRTVFFQYLASEHEALIPDFEHFIEDMRFVFEFLDQLEEGE